MQLLHHLINILKSLCLFGRSPTRPFVRRNILSTVAGNSTAPNKNVLRNKSPAKEPEFKDKA